MTLGARIRKSRRTLGRTLQEIADKSQVTKSLLSKIENEKTSPPIATLTRIAKALGVNITTLLSEEDSSGSTIHTKAEAMIKSMTKTDMGYSFFSIAGGRADKLMQTYIFKIKKGKTPDQNLNHRSEEFIYIIEGDLQYTVGSTTYTLKKGDSLYFDAEENHSFKAVSKEVTYLGVFVDRPKAKNIPKKKAKKT